MKKGGIIINVDYCTKMKKITEIILYWNKSVYDNIGCWYIYVKREEYLDIAFDGKGKL